MANIPLQSITFPGLSDKYTTPTVDATLTQTGAAADAKKTGDEISGLKNDLNQFPNGNYPQMGAGYANQLVSGLKKEDQTPYNFRRIPYDATLEEVEKIIGGTVAWNQRMDISNMADTTRDGITWKNNRDGTWTANGTATANSTIVILTLEHPSDAVKEGHKYFIGTGYDDATGASFRTEVISRDAENSNAIYIDLFRSTVVNAKKTGVNLFCELRVFSGVTANNFTFVPTLIDLTLVLGTTIADYVYSLEQATAGAGVAWLKTHFPKQFNSGYQAYDAGTLKSIEGLSGKKTVGFNQWDEVVELGYIGASSGENTPSNINIRSKNYIPVFPNTAYYLRTNFTQTVFCPVFFYDADKNFVSSSIQTIWNNAITTPSNARYMRFYMQENYGTTYNHDICINLSDPTKNGTYEPYEAHSYALDSDVVLRGIPKLDSNNNLYYDGDEYLPDGTVNRRYGIVDLGTLSWTLHSSGQFRASFPLSKDVPATEVANMLCTKYITVPYTQLSETDKAISRFFASTDGFNVKDSAYSDANAFKSSLSGVYLVYELATPTTETADPYQTPQIVSPDGTEEYIYTDGAFELPVGHYSDYPVDVSGQLDGILDTPSANGTYVLKATVADGAVTYSWVADA